MPFFNRDIPGASCLYKPLTGKRGGGEKKKSKLDFVKWDTLPQMLLELKICSWESKMSA